MTLNVLTEKSVISQHKPNPSLCITEDLYGAFSVQTKICTADAYKLIGAHFMARDFTDQRHSIYTPTKW